jgi:hypothetical protein
VAAEPDLEAAFTAQEKAAPTAKSAAKRAPAA